MLKNILLCFALVGCSAQTRVEEPKPEPKPEPVEIVEVPVCIDPDTKETLECFEHSDCCEGFECAYDPDKSHRQKYCIYAE